MSDVWILYSTFAKSGEALSAGKILVEERLIACANVAASVTSVYRWEGKVQEAPEATLIAKTSADLVPRAIARLKELHAYDTPCIAAWPVAKGHIPFLEWVMDETSGE